MKLSLTREDLIEALQELIHELRARKLTGDIRIVGGAALALSYFSRDVTQDIDALNMRGSTNEEVVEAARAVATRLDLNDNWLNFEVSRIDALPTLGREVQWIQIFSSAGITIHVASAEVLLAMKMRASRPGRDVADIRALLELVGISDIATAELLYEDYYPGDALSDRAIQILQNLLTEEVASPITAPPPPQFEG